MLPAKVSPPLELNLRLPNWFTPNVVLAATSRRHAGGEQHKRVISISERDIGHLLIIECLRELVGRALDYGSSAFYHHRLCDIPDLQPHAAQTSILAHLHHDIVHCEVSEALRFHNDLVSARRQ